MIKLIASDIDGTLIPEGTLDMNPEIYDVIRKLKEKGIIFIAASGRQYLSINAVFGPVEEEIMVISDNGAYIADGGKDMVCYSFEEELRQEILDYWSNIEGINILASVPNAGYTNCKDPKFLNFMKEGYNLDLKYIENLNDIKEPILKIAVYCESVDAAELAKPAIEKFEGRASVMAAGKHWVDFMKGNVSKGEALRKIQELLGITKEETMAFGDNNNDIPMLSMAGESYAVANARPEVKQMTKYVLNEEKDAVLNEIKKLLYK